MSDQRSAHHGVLALGFSAYEKATMESFFRIAAQRPPGWWLTDDGAQASVVLLSASSQIEFDALRPQILYAHKVLIVGNSDFGSGWLFLPRPIRFMVTLTKLAQLVAQNEDTTNDHQDTLPGALKSEPIAAAIKASPVPASLNKPIPSLPPLPKVLPSQQVISHLGSPAGQMAAVLPEPERVLVVDDSDVALKFMQGRLQKYGYSGQLARGGEEALVMVASYDFKFVFLDVMMAGLDGYQTCRGIKQYKSKSGIAPVVVMLTSRGGTIDKIRGAMAGCDGYLTKPLNDRLLLEILRKHDPKIGKQ